MISDQQLAELSHEVFVALDQPVIRFVEVDPRVLFSIIHELEELRLVQLKFKVSDTKPKEAVTHEPI